MEIKTRFNIGDKVWVLKNNKATEIEINAYVVGTDNLYVRTKDYVSYPENYCFASKQELIEYVTQD